MVHQEVLEKVDDPELRVYVVWEPILGSDSEQSSRDARGLIPDGRATHFWTSTRGVGVMFREPLELKNSVAWDVYLVYPPGKQWDKVAPLPDYYQHQLPGRLPNERLLDGEALARKVEALLEKVQRR